MKTADVMTRAPVCVTPETIIVEAARLMLQHRISGLPVVDADGSIAGIITEGDLLRRAETGTELHRSGWLTFLIGPGRLAGDYVQAHARKVGDVMTPDVAAVGVLDDLAVVVDLMQKRRVKRVPVVDAGKLVGIVSRADLLRALVRILTREAKAHAHDQATDEAIRDRIVAIVDKEPWGSRPDIDVTVKAGVVDLYGTVMDERERTALIVAAEGVAGVKAVNDRLERAEPPFGC